MFMSEFDVVKAFFIEVDFSCLMPQISTAGLAWRLTKVNFVQAQAWLQHKQLLPAWNTHFPKASFHEFLLETQYSLLLSMH